MDPNQQEQSGGQSAPVKSSRSTFFTLATVFVVCVIIVILLILYVLRILNTKSGKNAVPTPTPAQDTIKSANGTVYKLAQRTTIPKTVVCARFTSLKDALQNIDAACTLDLSGQNLSSLPPEISKLTKLAEIDLDKNNFTEFPPLLYELKSLVVIRFSDNKLSVFPEKIWDMKELTALTLSNNQLSSLSVPKQFTTVKTLWLDGNKIPPSQIEELKNAVPQIEIKE